MRWLLATALALAAVRSAQADPAAPQISPQPARHEDAQRLREQLRGLDRGAPTPPSPADAAAAGSQPGGSPSITEAPGSSGYRIAGIVLLSVAGASALTTISLFASTPSDPGAAASYDTPKLAFALTAGVTAVAGFLVLGHSRTLQVAPAVTPKAVGLAIRGRL